MRRSEQVFGLADLDKLAEIHDRDAMAQPAHRGQIVRDEEVRRAESLLQVAQQVQDVGTDRDVERRGRLVEHDQVGLGCDRAGDADPLQLAARSADADRGRRRPARADQAEKLGDPRLARRPASCRWSATAAPRSRRSGSGAGPDCRRDPGRPSAADAQLPQAGPCRLPTSCPSKRSVPEVGSISRRTQRPTVVLPEPLSPTSPTASPRRW